MKLNYDELIKQKDVKLSNKGSQDDALDVLYKVIEQSTVLEILWLSYNKLTLADGKLASAIAKSKTIKELFLSDNNISDEGTKYLADSLKKNNSLQILYLHNNNIGDDGAKYIADMLIVNKSLQKIDLSYNNVSDKGAEYLVDALNKSDIRAIYLQHNKIGNQGAEKFADALKSNHSIETLDLSYNKIKIDVKKRVTAILNDPKRKYSNKENEQETKGEDMKVKELKEENERLMKELADAQKKVVSARQVKDQLNSTLKEKEDALKLIASMKADITRKKEEIEKKEQEVKSRDTDIANKDQQLKSALDGIAKRDTDIAKKNQQLEQLESIKRILNPTATDDEGGEPANKRTRTEDTNKRKISELKYHHTHCSICASKFSADLDSKDENIRKHLPVLSSSKTCDHYFCYGCILQQQAAIAEKKQAPKWIPCMVCKMNTAFQPSEPKYHRLLIDILKQSEWVEEAPKVKEELVE